MTLFARPLVITPLPIETRWVLGVLPLPSIRTWRIDRAVGYTTQAGEYIAVKEGTITDLASIPRWLWPILPPDGDYLEAAVIHDELYRRHRSGDITRTRYQADSIFLEAMRFGNILAWERFLVYRGVRLGGKGAWRVTCAV